MAVRSREEILNAVKARFGEDTSDDTLTLIEDIDDTFKSIENSDNENWKQKYEENDKMWRQKYRDRFFNSNVEDEPPKEEETPPKTYEYKDLFKEESK